MNYSQGLKLHENMESVSQWAKKLANNVLEGGDTGTAAAIQAAIKTYHENRLVLAILGKAKRGKSTLMNAMLGRSDDKLAPIDKLPASSAITKFTWTEKESAAVTFRSGKRDSISYSRIREFVTEEYNPENKKEVVVVNVSGPFPGLDPHVELVDTPGAGSLHEHHDALLHGFIPQADAVIFMVTAKMPLNNDELDLLKQVKAADIGKVFFVVNKVDAVNEEDLAAAIQHNTALLANNGITVGEIYPISAKKAFQGNPNDSGLPEFLSVLNEFLATHKGAILQNRFISRVLSLVQPMSIAMDVATGGAMKSDAELDRELADLSASRNRMRLECDAAEKEFIAKWNRAVNELQLALPTARRSAMEKTTEHIASTSSFGLNAFAKQLPTFISRTLEESIEPASIAFEQAARSACEGLRHSYPSISTSGGGVYLKIQGETASLVAGVAGAAALAAGGAGIMMAGASTAAAIASANAAVLAAPAAIGSAAGTISGLLGFGGAAVAVEGATAGLAASALGTTAVSTPLWVALASPIGWTLAGMGAAAIPLAWKISKNKQRTKMESAAEDTIMEAFREFENVRLRYIRSTGENIVQEARAAVDKQIADIESALHTARYNRPSHADMDRVKKRSQSFKALVDQAPSFLIDGTGVEA